MQESAALLHAAVMPPLDNLSTQHQDRAKWTQPRFQSKDIEDRWNELTAIACWMIFLARRIVADAPLPWHKPQPRLTPQRVQQSIRPIFEQIGSPARGPKKRGKAPGWPPGRQSTPKQRYAVVKKTLAAAKTA